MPDASRHSEILIETGFSSGIGETSRLLSRPQHTPETPHRDLGSAQSIDRACRGQ
ncbi:hypothetical protein ACCUM_3282 [Candidatus Accumulibacter phosphatis]|uniref:Uncharacterized protein n=1 Tax=Candidatus Accumulibacter phosphatis TaxID=327160 RepID=A0A5S4EPV4_9PROT|nr:hypothetical protein ACCUM_3282 [Candidatus Accumulibacter phosphatis]